MNDNDIIKALNTAVTYYGVKVTSFLNQGSYPSGNDEYRPEYKTIQATQSIKPAKKSGSGIEQTITYGSSKEAPYAVAFEFGSGLGSSTKKEKYIIRPRNKKALLIGSKQGWFPQNLAAVKSSPKFLALSSEEDRYLFEFVEHPGISARPFAAVVLAQEINAMTKIVGQEIFAVIKVELEKI